MVSFGFEVLAGYFGRTRQTAMNCKPAIKPEVANTPPLNPAEPLNRLFSNIGRIIPPTPDPEATMPKASARFRGL